MVFAGMVKSSMVDYPGLIACTLFVPGCNYDCFYCHNRSLIYGTHEEMSGGYIDEFLKKRAGRLDAVVFSGGEPTLQPGLADYIGKIKRLGYKTKLDTNGSLPQAVAGLLDKGLCDYYAVDYKAPASRYGEICGRGADPSKTLETINLLLKSGAAFEVRTTVIPQLGLYDLTAMAKELPVLPRFVLNPYRPPEIYLPGDEERIKIRPYTKKEIAALADKIRIWQPNVTG